MSNNETGSMPLGVALGLAFGIIGAMGAMLMGGDATKQGAFIGLVIQFVVVLIMLGAAGG